MATVLSIVQDAADLIGIPRPTSVVGNPGQRPQQMLTMLRVGGDVMARLKNKFGGSWSFLEREFSFTTIMDRDYYELPQDYRELIDGTFWDVEQYREIRGTLSPQEWRLSRNGLVTPTSIYTQYRIRRFQSATSARRVIYLEPTPTDARDLILEYVSNRWISNAAGDAFKSSFTSDTDMPLFDGDLMMMDLIWRFKKARGLEFGTDLAEFEYERNTRLAGDAGPRTVSLGKRRISARGNIPDGNWPSGA